MKIKNIKKAIAAYEAASTQWHDVSRLLPCSAREARTRFPDLNWSEYDHYLTKASETGIALRALFGSVDRFTTLEALHLARNWVKLKRNPLTSS